MSNTKQKASPIIASLVPEQSRMGFLPAFFGPRLMMLGEPLVFHWMGVLSKDYNGGLWSYYTLSNRGFYMAPETEQRFKVLVVSNYFEGEMSADAAGIVATLYALGQLASRTEEDRIIELHHWLREYAREHAEWNSIYDAIS